MVNRSRIRGLALAGFAVALSGAIIVLTNSMPISADTPWPTPPPGPQAPVPKVIDQPNPVSTAAGETSWIIHPLAMQVPRFPPVPSATYRSPDGVAVISDAGSIDITLQLVYRSIDVDKAPMPDPRQELKKVFSLRAYDHQGDGITLRLRRPWVLQVPIRGLTEAFEDPARLLLAHYDQAVGWVPLVTNYHRSRGILQAWVLEVGQFAVLTESGATPSGALSHAGPAT